MRFILKHIRIQRFLRNNSGSYALALVVMLVVVLFVLKYTLEASTVYCTYDNWRFIRRVLIPFYHGDFDLGMLWQDPVHPSPIKALSMILNAKFLDLQMHYEGVLGVFFLFAFSIVLTLNCVRRYSEHLGSLSSVFIGVLLPFLFLSWSGYKNYQWPLLALGYIDFFLAALLLVFYEKIFLSIRIQWKAIVGLFLYNLVALVLSYHLFLIVNLAVLLVLLIPLIEGVFIALFREKLLRSKKPLGRVMEIRELSSSLTLISCGLCSIFFSVIVLKYIGVDVGGKSSDFLVFFKFLTTYPLQLIKTVGVALVFGFCDLRIFRDIGRFEPYLSVLGGLVFVFSVIVIGIYVVKKKYKTALLPLFLFVSFIVFMMVVLQNRSIYMQVDQHDYLAILWPKYFKWFQLGFVGLILMSFDIILETFKKHVFFLRSFMIVTLVLTLATWFASYEKLGRKLAHQMTEHDIISKSILSGNLIEMRKYYGVKADEKTLDFLKEHELNVFSDNYPWKTGYRSNQKEN